MRIHVQQLVVGVGIVCLLGGWASPVVIGQPETNSAFPELKKQQEQLTLENSIADQQLHKNLATLQGEIDQLTKQLDALTKHAALKETERKTQLDDELAPGRARLEKLKLTNDLAAAELAGKGRELAQREQELKVRTAELQTQRSEFELQLAKLNTDLELRAKRDLWKNRVNHEIQYTKDPFKDGVLTISDRRIALNGPIGMDTADYIAERVDYFNNQSREFPIFIVIDRSPGGSVMAGYKILKAMDGSAAPVYVVVKSFAASMAANIATQAKKSFAYPNAIVLHHQILTGSFGNLTAQKENLRDLEEWWKRLATPVAAKMGIGLDEFIKRMYQNRSTGDWEEFGDSARKLKWVDEVAETVREESYDKNPDAPAGVPAGPAPVRSGAPATLAERVDVNGHRYVVLPRLDPVDCYYLYNPDNYYRLAP